MTYDSIRVLALSASYLALAIFACTLIAGIVMYRKPELRSARMIRHGAYTGLGLALLAAGLAFMQIAATSAR